MADLPQSLRTVPPPPPKGELEVSIRTLASDLSLLKRTGGVSSFSSPRTPSASQALPQTPGPSRDTFLLFVWVLIGVMGTAILFFLGYTVLPKLVGGSAGSPSLTSSSSPKKTVQSEAPVSFGHQSLFRTPVPELSVSLGSFSTPPTRATLSRSIADRMSGASGGDLEELVIQDVSGKDLSFSDTLALFESRAFSEPFWRTKFNPSVSFGLFKDAYGISPVYVLKLADGENPIALQQNILSLEDMSADDTLRLFLTDPGEPIGGFMDAQVSGQPVRLQRFASASFVYGWFFSKYLIVGTSEAAVKAAIQKL